MRIGRDSNSDGSNISVVGLLGVAFVVLKLCHVIDWSWWWVLAPFWGTLTVVVMVLAVIVMTAAMRQAWRR